MVVDDTAVIREAVARLLRREGFKTVCAANGREALIQLRLNRADLILLDVMMPEMDGLSCLEELRRNPAWQTLPVIMMTALSDDEHMRLAESMGISDYIVKARFSAKQMLDRVKKCIPIQ
jgi:DNA-binding response OmpR family regulator